MDFILFIKEFNGYRFILLALFLMFTASGYSKPVTASTPPFEPVGAVCVITHDDKMLFVSEIITGRFALPGGFIDEDETPQQAAEREVLEETGLRVRASSLLAHSGRAAIYNCVAESPIAVARQKSVAGFNAVAAWQAKHFGREVKAVYLMSPEDIPAKRYRFSDQYPDLKNWLAQGAESQVRWYSDLSAQAGAVHKLELPLIAAFQSWVDELPGQWQPFTETLLRLLNSPGESWVIIIAVPFIFVWYGRSHGLHLIFLICATVFAVTLLKVGFASPRPFYLVPGLQQTQAFGYGLPSGHTVMGTVIWGALWYEVARERSRRFSILSFLLALVLAAGQGIARVWLGVNFITDTLLGFLVGSLIVSAYVWWRQGGALGAYNYLTSIRFKTTSLVLLLMLAGVTQLSEHVFLWALVAGLILGTLVPEAGIETQNGSDPNLPMPLLPRVALVLIAVGTSGALLLSVTWISRLLTGSITILTVKTLGLLLIACWLTAGIEYVRAKLSELPKEPLVEIK